MTAVDPTAPSPFDREPEVRDAVAELEAASDDLHALHARAIAGEDVTVAAEQEARSRIRLAELGVEGGRLRAKERLEREHAERVAASSAAIRERVKSMPTVDTIEAAVGEAARALAKVRQLVDERSTTIAELVTMARTVGLDGATARVPYEIRAPEAISGVHAGATFTAGVAVTDDPAVLRYFRSYRLPPRWQIRVTTSGAKRPQAKGLPPLDFGDGAVVTDRADVAELFRATAGFAVTELKGDRAYEVTPLGEASPSSAIVGRSTNGVDELVVDGERHTSLDAGELVRRAAELGGVTS